MVCLKLMTLIPSLFPVWYGCDLWPYYTCIYDKHAYLLLIYVRYCKKKLRENFCCSIYRIDYYDTLFDLYFNSFCLKNLILQNCSKNWGVKFVLGAFNHYGEVNRYANML